MSLRVARWTVRLPQLSGLWSVGWAGAAPVPPRSIPDRCVAALVLAQAQIALQRELAQAEMQIKRDKAHADMAIAAFKARQWAEIERFKSGLVDKT